MKEKFKPIFINNEKTIYMISNKGRCINIKRGTYLKPHKLRRNNKILEPVDPENCYYDYALYHNKKYFYKGVGRLVAENFIPIPQKYIDAGFTMEDLEVDHIDNYRPHNEYTNLQWLTKQENHDKMLKSGNFRVPTSSKHGNCKLSETQLDLVGKLLEKNSLNYQEISDITKVPVNTIGEIRAKRRFVYLSEKYNFDNFDCYQVKPKSEETIKKVMELLQDTSLSAKKIAIETGVSVSLVKDILKGRCHKDISKNYNFKHRKGKKYVVGSTTRES